MDLPSSGAGGNFLEQLLADLMKMMGAGAAGSGARIELARTLAHGVATGNEPEGNVDPLDRMQLDELVRLAEMHVGELTGLQTAPGGAPLDVSAVGPGAWAWQTVDDWRFLLDAMTGTAGTGETGGAGETGAIRGTGESRDRTPSPTLGLADLGELDLSGLGDVGDLGGGPADLLARWMTTMGPMLAAMQLGSAVGHLARVTLGQYEVPVPRPSPGRLLLVPANINRFASDWSLQPDQVRLWVCLREVTVHTVLGRPHVAERMSAMLVDVVQTSAQDTAGMMERLEGLDPGDPEALQRLIGEPEAIFDVEPSPERRQAAERLMAVTAALLGYVEHVLDQASSRLLGGRGALTEAWRRRQVDREAADRSAEMLLGLDLGPAQVDRGAAFVGGVLERGGDEGLARLWESSETLPTPAEIDAPGLWLERISL